MMIETSILSALQLNICTKEESIFPGTFRGKIRKNGASFFGGEILNQNKFVDANNK